MRGMRMWVASDMPCVPAQQRINVELLRMKLRQQIVRVGVRHAQACCCQHVAGKSPAKWMMHLSSVTQKRDLGA